MGRPLKDMLRALGLSDEAVAGTTADREVPQPILDGKSARFALSTLGTDWGRNMISPNIWANAVRAKIQARALASDASPIVIDDLRFPSDWEVVSSFGGLIVTIRRPSIEVDRTLIDRMLHTSGLQRLISANGMFGWAPLHETEFHWRDAPSCGEVNNTGAIADAMTSIIGLIASQGSWPRDAAEQALF